MQDQIAPTIKTNQNSGVAVKDGEREDSSEDFPNDREEGKLRIRYLTPRECFRLMGFTDDEIDSIMAVETSKSRLYKMAGNSIVVDVLAAIFHNIYVEPTFERAKVTSLDHFFKVI